MVRLAQWSAVFVVLLLELTNAVTVTVFSNGESTGGVKMEIFPKDFGSGNELAAYLSSFVFVDGMLNEEGSSRAIADRVYSGAGVLVNTYEDIKEDDRLYLVAPDTLFVWPFVELGHRVYIDSKQSPTNKPIVLESFSDSPRVFLIENFFTNEEADAVIERILEIEDEDFKLKRSTVGHDSSIGLKSNVRTSENAYDSQSPIAMSLMKRSFDLLGLGEFNSGMADGLQLLRYQLKQAYIPHYDWFAVDTTKDFNWNPRKNGANRFATVFLYLSNVTKGGQTVFPLAEMPPTHSHDEMPSDEELSSFEKGTWEYKMVKQCYTKMAAYPVKTRAVLFYNQKGNGELDTMAEHGGCPVVEGTKWAANLWVWNKSERTRHAETSINFYNLMDSAVDVFWSETKMYTLEPGKSLEGQISYGGLWTLRDPASGAILVSHRLDMRQSSPQTISVPRQETDSPPLSSDAIEEHTEEYLGTKAYVNDEL